MGWHKGPAENGRCFFLGVMDYNYLVFLYFGTIITPALLLAVFYAHIYHVVLKQLRQIVTINPYNGSSSSSGRATGGGTMLRVLGAAQKREVKATQNLSIIVLFFMICWIPLYTINCIWAFCRECRVNSTFVLSCIILSHLNSAGNPLLYAYHLKDFRAALKAFICNMFGIKVQQPANNAALNNNFTHYRLQSLREAQSTMSLNRNNRFICESQMRSHTLPLPSPNKISTLIRDSVSLAAATAEPNRDIWRISEMSEEMNHLHHHHHYHLNHNHQRRSISSSDDASLNDDVFLPTAMPALTLNLNMSGANANVRPNSTPVAVSTSPSSAAQLSRSLYVLEPTPTPTGEHNLAGFMRREMNTANADGNSEKSEATAKDTLTIASASGDFIHSPAKSLKLSVSPFKAVGELLKTSSSSSTNGGSGVKMMPPRSCSLSEESEGVRYRNNNGFLPENHSYN